MTFASDISEFKATAPVTEEGFDIVDAFLSYFNAPNKTLGDLQREMFKPSGSGDSTYGSEIDFAIG